MTRPNTKFIAILAASVILLGAGTHVLHGFQVHRTAEGLRSLAARMRKEGKVVKAADCYQRYLALVPTDTKTLAEYGQLLTDKKLATTPKALFRAYLILDQAVRREPERSDLRRQAISVAMDIGRFSDAKDHLDILLNERPSEAAILNQRGRCREELGDFPAARTDFEKAVELAPKDTDNYVRLAALLRNHSKEVRLNAANKEKAEPLARVIQIADETIDNMVARNADNFQAYLLRIRYRRTFQSSDPDTLAERSKEIEADLARARQLAPDNLDVLLATAEFFRDNGKKAEARKILEHSRQLFPTEWRPYSQLCLLDLEDDAIDSAIAQIQDGLKKIPNQLELLWSLAELQVRLNRKDDAEKTIDKLAEKGMQATYLRFLRARLRIAQEEWLKAARLLEDVVTHTTQKDWFALNIVRDAGILIGECYEQLGDTYSASSAFRQVLAAQPRSIRGQMALARVELAMGKVDAAIDRYVQMMRLPEAPVIGWVEIARLVMIRNFSGSQPNLAEVDAALRQAERLRPAPPTVVVLRAEMLAVQKKYAEARAALENYPLENKARPVEIWIALAGIEEHTAEHGKALEILRQAEQDWPGSIEVRLAMIRHWSRRDAGAARAPLSKLESPEQKWGGPTLRRLYRGLANAYVKLGLADEARRVFRQMAKQYPNDVGSRLALFDHAFRDDDETEMSRIVDELRQAEGEAGGLWRYCALGQLLSKAKAGDKQVIDQARVLLSQVAAKYPGWTRLLVCEGHLSQLQQDENAAIKHYQEAVYQGERAPHIVRRTVELLIKHARQPEADQLLKRVFESNSDFGELNRYAAELALYKRDTARALQLSQLAVKTDSSDYRDYVWLGEMYWRTGQSPKEAEAVLRKAVALAQRAGQPRVALVRFLVQTGDKERAQVEIKQAQENLSKDEALLAIPYCYELIQQRDEAEKLYEVALKTKPNDLSVLHACARFYLESNKVAKANPLLEQLESRQAEAPAEAAWARRARAFLRAAEGGFQNHKEALALLGVTDDASLQSGSAADLRVRAVIAASGKSVRERRQAVGLFENLQKRQPLSIRDQIILSQLYDSTGESKKSHNLMRRILASLEERLALKDKAAEGIYLQCLFTFIPSLLREKTATAADEAKVWLDKLERQEPASQRTAIVKARVLKAQGNGAEAVRSLLTFAKVGKAVTLATLARELEELNEPKTAENVFRQLAADARQPKNRLLLAQFLGRQKRTQDALVTCRAARETCPPLEVAEATLVAFQEGKAAPEDYEEAATWLESLIAKSGGNELLDTLAAIRYFQGRYADALRIYRQIIAGKTADPLVLNNAAWLVARCEENGSEALKLIERAIEIEGPTADLLGTRACVHLLLGQPAAAVKDLEDVVVEQNTNPESFFHLARAQHMMKNLPAARAAFEQAKRCGLSDQSVHPLDRLAYQQLRAELDVKLIRN